MDFISQSANQLQDEVPWDKREQQCIEATPDDDGIVGIPGKDVISISYVSLYVWNIIKCFCASSGFGTLVTARSKETL